MRRLLVLVALFFSLPAQAVTIDWVRVGNLNNPPDRPSTNCFATNCGSVGYAYSISKYEVTNAQYAEFLNAKAASDPLGLFNESMATFGGITRSGVSGSYTYTAKTRFANKPVTYVSFYDALRFANWLNNGQGSADTETGAYTLLGGTATPSNGLTVMRNDGANVFLPSENEWYKAAYYSPYGVYFEYPTGTDSVTECVAPGSDTGNSANCNLAVDALTDAGAYGLSDSPYGTYDQGGNVGEWNEEILNFGFGSTRGRRGGSWYQIVTSLAASNREGNDPTNEYGDVGLRVASRVPEPIDWVVVGNPNNLPDAPATNCYAANCGSVDHGYSISKNEVTNFQYAEFLNAKAASDPLGLYNPNMDGDATFGGITRSGVSGSFTYTSKADFANKPVTYVSFYDSLRFANWLNNGQGSGDTETGAYTITVDGINENTITRNGGAKIVLPSENEWYKAAYYSRRNYFDYPTQTDSVTECVVPGSDTGNSANCNLAVGALTDAGAYGRSRSHYGTYDQGGNVWEWNEQIVSGSGRGIRGGYWIGGTSFLTRYYTYYEGPTNEFSGVGFRVASLVPEPGAGLLGMTAVLGLAARRKRTAKAL